MTGRRPAAGYDKLLESAGALFADAGYERVTTKQLAAGAGLSIGALYHHFPSKLDAYRAAVEWGISRISPPRIEGGDARREFGELISWFCSVISAPTTESQLLRLELLDPHLAAPLAELPPFSVAFAHFQTLTHIVAPGADAEELIASIVALSFGFARLDGLMVQVPGFAAKTSNPSEIAEAVMRIVLRANDFGQSVPSNGQ